MTPKLSSEDRKLQIIAVARTLFATKGFEGTTLDDIAAKAGISRPRVIQLFGSKQQLYETIAVTAYRAHPLDQDLAEPIRRKDDYSIFEAFARHILRHSQKREDRENLKILMNARFKEDRFHRLHFQEQDTLMISRLEVYFTERMQAGAFCDINPRTIIFAYQAMVLNLAIYKNVMNRMDFVTIEELSRDCARIFLNGIVHNSKKGKV